MQRIPHKLSGSSRREKVIPLCMAFINYCFSNLEIVEGQSVSLTVRRFTRGSKVHFVVDNKGSRKDQGVKIFMDSNGDGTSHGNQSEAKVVPNLV